QVVNIETDREVVVRVNDRGPLSGGGMIEVSRRAADLLGFKGAQAAQVRVRYLGPAPKAGARSRAPAASISATSLTPVVAPARPKAAPTLSPAAAPTLGDYFVQVGSFAELGNAQRFRQALSSGHQVQLSQVRVNNADFFRVLVGPVTSKRSAQVLRDHLAEQGIADGLVIKGR
ncbi:MAG: SPOR domain-containing protein, partial [Pseudomonadota bacterium]